MKSWRLGLLVLALLANGGAEARDLLESRDASPRILSVAEAFQVQPALWRDGQLLIGIDIAPGCYLYRDKFSVEVLAPKGYALGRVDLPAGNVLEDEHFGKVRVLRQQLSARYQPKPHTAPQRVRIRYQGCAENLVCYPPQQEELTVETVR